MDNFNSSGTQPFTITSAYTHSGDSAYYNVTAIITTTTLLVTSVFDFTNMSNGSLEFGIHKQEVLLMIIVKGRVFPTNNGSSWFRMPSTNYNGSASTYTGTYPYFDEYSYTLWGI